MVLKHDTSKEGGESGNEVQYFLFSSDMFVIDIVCLDSDFMSLITFCCWNS